MAFREGKQELKIVIEHQTEIWRKKQLKNRDQELEEGQTEEEHIPMATGQGGKTSK